MNPTLAKALIALVPISMLLFGSLILFLRGRAFNSLLQFLGTACQVLVVLAHIAEARHWLPWMHWGLERGAGHYLDLSGAILGLTLFPLGYLLHAVVSGTPRPRTILCGLTTDSPLQ